MQLDPDLAAPDGDLALPPKALAPLTVRAFGQSVLLNVTSDVHLRDDSHWRLRAIYEPALASQTLAATGVAVDVGAGFGSFALPFALAFPNWTLWAFEPEPEAYAALRANLAAYKLTNVVAVNAAVAGAVAGEDTTAIATALAGGISGAELDALLPKRAFRRHVDMRGVIEASDVISADFEPCHYGTVPSEALRSLRPNLLKLTAPCAEAGVLQGLTAAPLDHLIGESWTHLPSALVYGPTSGLRQTWIPRAGDPLLRLRRSLPLSGRREGLDVVVAMYNAAPWIAECLGGILNGASDDTRVLVVDDASTDGSGAVVRESYAGDDRVVLHSKPNGGCASARNFGRMQSDASHIAFVDADDVPGPGLFAGLLDLARHTGAEIVQGGFELLHEGPGGERRGEPSYEASLDSLRHAHRHPFAPQPCHLVPSAQLMQGQPSIWRRVYRRDFLDNKKIWFPEHIRAFDDQLFQMLTLQAVANVPMLDGVSYLYRQHDRQDIRQGDERGFYSLEMFRLVLKRGVTEGWRDFHPVLKSFVNTVNWCWSGLRPDLRPAFERAAAELWVHAGFALGAEVFADLPAAGFAPPDFGFLATQLRRKLTGIGPSLGGVYLDAIEMHAGLVRRES